MSAILVTTALLMHNRVFSRYNGVNSVITTGLARSQTLRIRCLCEIFRHNAIRYNVIFVIPKSFSGPFLAFTPM